LKVELTKEMRFQIKVLFMTVITACVLNNCSTENVGEGCLERNVWIPFPVFFSLLIDLLWGL